MPFDRAGFTKAATAMGYTPEEINQVATLREAQESSPANQAAAAVTTAEQQSKIRTANQVGQPVKTYGAPSTTYNAPAVGGQSTYQASVPQTQSTPKKSPTRQEARNAFIKAGYTSQEADAEVNKKYGTQTPQAPAPKKKGIIESIANFMAPRLSGVVDQAVNIPGMVKDTIEYKLASDPKEKQKQLLEYNQKRQKVAEAQKSYGFDADKKGNQFDAGQYAKGTAKTALEAGSFLAPVGEGIKGMALAGGAMGAMRGASEGENFQPLSIAGGIVGGAVTGGTLGLVGKAIGGVKNKIAQSAVQNLGKGTPSMWQKAAEQHGVDLNGLIRKYYPKGADYDAVLGGIEARGKGGVLGDVIKGAEEKIQATAKAAGTNIRIMPTELISALRSEARNIGSEIGGGSRKAAIDKIITETEKKYAKGVSVNQAIKTLRYANEKFGKNIVEVNAGDAVATAAQKLEGNTLRTALKGMFPQLAQALDTQSEVYTLRPVLNRARAILNTEGSAIRAGQMANVNLWNPLSWGNVADVVMQNPQRASKWMNRGGLGNVGSAIGEGVGKTSEFVGSLAGAKVGSALTPQEDKYLSSTINSGTNPQGGEQVQNGVDHGTNLAQNPQDVKLGAQPTTYGTGKSPEYWNQQYQQASSAGDEVTAKYANDQYDKEIAYQKANAPANKKPFSNQQVKDMALANNGQRGLDVIKQELGYNDQTGEVGSDAVNTITKLRLAPFHLGSRKLYKALFDAAGARLRIESGAALSPDEIKRYVDKYIGELADDPSALNYEIQQLDDFLGAIATQKPEDPVYSNQGLGGTPPQL